MKKNAYNIQCVVNTKGLLGFVFTVFIVLSVKAQTQQQDSTKTGYNKSELLLPKPTSIASRYTYDPLSDRYIYNESIGNFNISYPIILTPQEYDELVRRESQKAYYKSKISAFDGNTQSSKDARKNLLPEFYVNSDFFESIFGGNTITLIPQGSVEMDLGVIFTKIDNPIFSPRNRRNFSFDFDQRISLSLNGKVGELLQINANYDTESTFTFQNIIKLDYQPDEDDILRNIEVGNVSMPLNTSLITGAQSLFGVKAEVQFGKTSITGVFSEQRSETNTVISEQGGITETFELFAREYDENRHFFLGQYFRNNFDKALSNYPYINSQVQITRIEVWVTNRTNRTDNVRSIVALQDLGEANPERTGIAFNDAGNPQALPAGFFNTSAGAYIDNGNNDFDPTKIGESSVLTKEIRDIATADQGFSSVGTLMREGIDYGKLENARKLIETQEYTVHTELGYISLNQRLDNDEILAVAYQYTVGGQVFQVGEFSQDGIDPDPVTGTPGTNVNQNTNLVEESLVVKLLKSPITNVNEPIWDLMMKNVYSPGRFQQLDPENFKLNIFYTEASPLNYITAVNGDFGTSFNGQPIEQTPLLQLFNWDRLNFNNDPQEGGDGFFDFVPNITVMPQTGKLIFTKVEPFGRYLFDVLDNDNNPADNKEDYEAGNFNPNQEKYVYDVLYKSTKIASLEEVEKNKFQLKGSYKTTQVEGIPIGSFNVPRGSVHVTAGSRVLVEGIDYTVNYELGLVQILDESLLASNIPIKVSTENSTLFNQQTRRFIGLNVEHQFSENFILGATYLNLKERPLTQKSTFNQESVNNTIIGFNGNYSTELPFLTRLVNKLPNIDTDVESRMSVRGEFAYLSPDAPDAANFDGEATSYIDDFEGSQSGIDIKSPFQWNLSSRPLLLNVPSNPNEDQPGIQNGYQRAMINWYSIDPIFYSTQRPDGITDEDLSGFYNSRVFIEELFPDRNLVVGETTILNTLDLAYYPTERGPYNFQPGTEDGVIDKPEESWAGITRQLTATNFEASNVEYIEFWLQDPFQESETHTGGTLVFNLGNISEDIIKDGRKLYENGLPKDGDVSQLEETQWGTVVPQNQSLIYAFDSEGQQRVNQDVGYDGYSDNQEAAAFGANFGEDPANDNYNYFLNEPGNIFQRYKRYNGLEGNTPDSFSNTNRGSTTEPDVEDINRDNTMNTIDSYFEYQVNIEPQFLPDSDVELENLPDSNPLKQYLTDFKERPRSLPNGQVINVKWHLFRIPVRTETQFSVNGISDLRSIRFVRMYMTGFKQSTILRFGTLDLVRSNWRRYNLTLDQENDNLNDNTDFDVEVVSTQENDGSYVSPPSVVPEQLNINNTIVDQNEQSLVIDVCNLEAKDSRAVFKNFSLDMRQYKKLRMFLHVQQGLDSGLADNDLVAFIRLGNDLNENYYQIEIPLKVSDRSPITAENLWPDENRLTLLLEHLQEIKSRGIFNNNLQNDIATFYDVIDGQLSETPVPNPFEGYQTGQQRIGIKGFPNYGEIRNIMLGVKNVSGRAACGQVWFNELRMSDLENEGGWAAVLSMDANLADFANISASGRRSTVGFGSLEQRPNERSREDVKQYDLVTNVNLGQLLPKKWGIQLPLNYAQSEESITPKYDQFYRDIKYKTQLDNTANKDSVRNVNENYTKLQSINFIGVRKNRTTEKEAKFYDVENLTFNYSYNKAKHRDFEIENAVTKNVRTGVNYAYSFKPIIIEPFKKNDSILKSDYWQFLKDFNLNLAPTSVTVNTNINRSFNKQKYREIDLGGDNIGVNELFRRNYTFDFEYVINYNLTNSLQLNFAASNSNIVRNYFIDDIINGRQNPELDIWDGFFDLGDPNRQYQQLGINYKLPFDKFPMFNYIESTYSYIGDFQWQKGSDLFGSLEQDGQTYNLGNSIQNSNTHTLNTTLDMRRFYRYIGLTKQNNETQQANRGATDKEEKIKKNTFKNIGIDVLTSIKNIQLNYSETNGTYLPGYLPTPGFIGTLKPTLGYTLGSQRDIRYLAAEQGWLTTFNNFNQQYTEVTNRQLNYTTLVEPFSDFRINFVGNRIYSENTTENFNTIDTDNDGFSDLYNPLIKNSYGNFSISTIMIGTSFQSSDDVSSKAFEKFRDSRLTIARRLAAKNGVNMSNPDNFEGGDINGFPLGYSRNNQNVLLPAFLAAYMGKSADNASLRALRDVPLPNWDIRYNGLMKIAWFREKFKRFSITHGYRSRYTINQFRANLEYQEIDFSLPYQDQPEEALDNSNDYKSARLYSNVNLSETFSPLIKLDMEMQNSIRISTEVRKGRLISLSFDNNLMTEVRDNEYVLGLGYRIKNLRIPLKLAGPKKQVVSDLLMEANISVRDNKTIIRYLDADNNQITSGQTIWGLKYNAEYAFSKNLSGIFYFDYTFSKYAISTAFPQTTIRSGLTVRYNFGN